MMDKHDIRYRQHLANVRRIGEIEQILKTIPVIPLPEPVQKGWYVYYDLREDIKRRVDSFDIQQAVDIGYSAYGRVTNVKRVKEIRRGEKGYYTIIRGMRHWISYCPDKTWVTEREYENMPPPVKKYFHLDVYDERYIKYGRKIYRVSLPDYYLVLKCRPIIHTHYSAKGGKLEKERDFLKDEVNRYWLLSTGGYRTSYPAYKDRARTRAKIQKFKTGEIDDITVEKVPKEYDY